MPAILLGDQRKVKRKNKAAARAAAKAGAFRSVTPEVSVSTKSAAAAAVAAPAEAVAGGFLVQVGTFGVAANAAGAGARLQALGLPVAKARITRGGKALQIVYAGPFASVAQAQRARALVRGAGFVDAILK